MVKCSLLRPSVGFHLHYELPYASAYGVFAGYPPDYLFLGPAIQQPRVPLGVVAQPPGPHEMAQPQQPQPQAQYHAQGTSTNHHPLYFSIQMIQTLTRLQLQSSATARPAICPSPLSTQVIVQTATSASPAVTLSPATTGLSDRPEISTWMEVGGARVGSVGRSRGRTGIVRPGGWARVFFMRLCVWFVDRRRRRGRR